MERQNFNSPEMLYPGGFAGFVVLFCTKAKTIAFGKKVKFSPHFLEIFGFVVLVKSRVIIDNIEASPKEASTHQEVITDGSI